jgi:hypothetical protein
LFIGPALHYARFPSFSSLFSSIIDVVSTLISLRGRPPSPYSTSTSATMTSSLVITYYPYFQPSAAAAGVMCALFAIGFIVSTYQSIRYKSWIWFVMLLAILSKSLLPVWALHLRSRCTFHHPFFPSCAPSSLFPSLFGGIKIVCTLAQPSFLF